MEGVCRQTDSNVKNQGEASGGACKFRQSFRRAKRIVKSTSSCPPGRTHSASVGPWSGSRDIKGE